MLVYLAHPFQGDPKNLVTAKRWLQWTQRFASQQNAIAKEPFLERELHVVAPWIPLCEVLDDANEIDRRHGLRGAMALFSGLQGRAFSVWAFNKIGTGSRFEMDACLHFGGEAWDMTSLGPEPPTDLFDPREAEGVAQRTELTPEWWRVIE
jgi:hypothetical protein